MTNLEASLQLEIAQYQAAFAKARGEIDRLKQKAKSDGQGLGTSLFGPLKGVIAGLGVAKLGSEIFEAVLKMDTLEKTLRVTEGSAEGAARRFAELRDVGRLPGLSMESAVKGDIRLRAIGFSADESKRIIMEMGNALSLVGGTQEDLDGVFLAISQISSKGKVMAQEINQLGERLPQVRKIMIDTFGTANSEAIQALGLDANDFIKKLVDGFSQLERAQPGLREDLTELGTIFTQLANDVFSPLLHEIIPAFRDLATLIAENKESLKGFGSTAASAFREIVAMQHAVGNLLTAIMNPGEVILSEEADKVITRQATFLEALKQLNDKDLAEQQAKLDGEAAPKPKDTSYHWKAPKISGTGGAGGDKKDKDPFKEVEAAQKKYDAAADKLALDQMTREEKIADLRKRLAQELPEDPFGVRDQAEVIRFETQRLELQRELNSLLKEQADEGQKMLDKELELEDKQRAAKQSIADEIALLRAKAGGNTALIESMERELKIREKAKEIEERTGVSAEKARAAAAQMIALEEQAARRRESKRGADDDDTRRGHIRGVQKRTWMQSGLDEFHRMQRRDGTAGTAFGAGGLSTRGGHHRDGPLSTATGSIADRAVRNASRQDSRDRKDSTVEDLLRKQNEILEKGIL